MSDTPATDALASEHYDQRVRSPFDDWEIKQRNELVTLSQKLERECNALRAIFPKILDALESGFCSTTCSIEFLNEIPKEVRLVRQKLERERNMLAGALRDVINSSDSTSMYRTAKDALNKLTEQES